MKGVKAKIEFDLYKQSQDIARVGSWFVDLVKNKTTWSDVTKEIHELPLDFEPNVEKGIEFYKAGEHRNRIIEAVTDCMQSGTPFDLELIIVTAKNNERWVRAIGQANRRDGETIGLTGIFQDIHATKKQELAYKTIQQRKDIATSAANIGVWDFDIQIRNYTGTIKCIRFLMFHQISFLVIMKHGNYCTSRRFSQYHQ